MKKLNINQLNFWAGDEDEIDLGKITERSKESTEFDCLNSDRNEFLLSNKIDKSELLRDK